MIDTFTKFMPSDQKLSMLMESVRVVSLWRPARNWAAWLRRFLSWAHAREQGLQRFVEVGSHKALYPRSLGATRLERAGASLEGNAGHQSKLGVPRQSEYAGALDPGRKVADLASDGAYLGAARISGSGLSLARLMFHLRIARGAPNSTFACGKSNEYT